MYLSNFHIHVALLKEKVDSKTKQQSRNPFHIFAEQTRVPLRVTRQEEAHVGKHTLSVLVRDSSCTREEPRLNDKQGRYIGIGIIHAFVSG